MVSSNLSPALGTCDSLKRAGFPQDTVFVWANQSRPMQRPMVAPRDANGARWREACAAPTLTEVLAALPTELRFEVPHPILGTVERVHTLEVRLGDQTEIGYHILGSHEVQHRTAHENVVEAAARLYLALYAASRLPRAREQHSGLVEEPMARAA